MFIKLNLIILAGLKNREVYQNREVYLFYKLNIYHLLHYNHTEIHQDNL